MTTRDPNLESLGVLPIRVTVTTITAFSERMEVKAPAVTPATIAGGAVDVLGGFFLRRYMYMS